MALGEKDLFNKSVTASRRFPVKAQMVYEEGKSSNRKQIRIKGGERHGKDMMKF